MIDLNKLLNKYGFSRIDFCKAMDIHPNNFARLKDIENQKFSTIERIHNITKIPYNELFGRQVFTTENIGIQDVSDTGHVSVSDTILKDKELLQAIADHVRKLL